MMNIWSKKQVSYNLCNLMRTFIDKGASVFLNNNINFMPLFMISYHRCLNVCTFLYGECSDSMIVLSFKQ